MRFGHVSYARRRVAVLVMALALAGCSSTSSTPMVVIVTPTPAASTPAPTPTIEPTPTVTPTETPSPTPSPTSAAEACTGTAENKAFFVDAASKLKFDVYCAVLPSSWWLDSGFYVVPDGGYLNVEYKNAAGASFTLREGAWCPPEKACIAHGPAIGPAPFDGLAGTLHLNAGTYTLEVGTWADPAYLMVGSGMSEAQFRAWAAALVKVG
jgi:hypothetical protein